MDIVDTAQELELLQRQQALQNSLQLQKAGRSSCAECGEFISYLREKLGATLCVLHQEQAERSAQDHKGRGRFCDLFPRSESTFHQSPFTRGRKK